MSVVCSIQHAVYRTQENLSSKKSLPVIPRLRGMDFEKGRTEAIMLGRKSLSAKLLRFSSIQLRQDEQEELRGFSFPLVFQYRMTPLTFLPDSMSDRPILILSKG